MRGAGGDVMNRNQIPAITVVNQFYDKLGDMMLDRFLTVQNSNHVPSCINRIIFDRKFSNFYYISMVGTLNV